jgi:hypothetical protein
MFLELDFEFTHKFLKFFSYYFGKSCVQAFEGDFIFGGTFLGDRVYTTLNQTAAYVIWCIALIHFVLGLVCIDRYRMKKPWAKK